MNLLADYEYIHWLLYDSGLSRYKICNDLGISESTLSRLVNGQKTIGSIRFSHAVKLTDYAKNAKELKIREV